MNEWMNVWMNEWMNEWLNEWMNEYMNNWLIEKMKNEWTNEGINEWTNELVNEWKNEKRTNEWMNERTNEWMNEWMNGWVSEWMSESSEWVREWGSEWANEWINGRKECMNEWVNEWINGWTNERTNEWMNEWIEWMNQWNTWMKYMIENEMHEWINENCRLFFQRGSGTVSCFYGFYLKSSSRYSLVHLLPTSSSKSIGCFYIFKCKPSSRYSPVRRLPMSSSKSAPTLNFEHFQWLQAEPSLQSCALFVGNSCRSRPATAETKTLYTSATTEATWPGKKHRVSHPRVFSSLDWRVPDLLHDDDDNDVVDMMVRMLPITIVRNSEVFQLNILWLSIVGVSNPFSNNPTLTMWSPQL